MKILLFFVFVLLVFVTTVSAYCGDRILDPSEECDDGNLINSDGCSANCKIEKEFCKFASYAEATSENPAGSLAIYATGAPDAPKVGQCSEWSGYGYTWSPQNWNIKANLTLFYDEAVYATNFTIYGDYGMCWSRMWLKNSATGEERIVFNGINTQCESTHTLDGSFLADVLILETCGTSWSSTDAVQLCKTPTTCGNNIIEEGEECDDGNLINGDGCSASCKIEECICNDDCNHLDKDYCNGDTITHDEGICVNYMCEVDTTIVEDCGNKIMIMNDCGRLQWGCSEELNDVHCALINIRPDDGLCPNYCSGDIAKDGKCTALTYRCVYDELDCNTYDNNYCCGTKIMHDDYICSSATCILDSITVKECDNNLVCDGQETCLNAQCVDGNPIDCSPYNIQGIATCFNDPDNIKFTFDFRNSFISQCTEPFGICTKGDLTITHSCDEIRCGAECDEDVDCKATDCDYLDGCRGRDYYDYDDVFNSCLENCVCTNNQCGAPTIYYNDPRCGECDNDNDCNRLDTECADGVCNLQTYRCEQKFKPSTTLCRASAGVCDIEEYCTGSCANCPADIFKPQGTDCGVCAACNRIGSCSYDETQDNDCKKTECLDSCDIDAIHFTFDYADDVPNECTAIFTCSQYQCVYSHECSVSNCGAECDSTHGCEDTDCDYLDGCRGRDYYDYDDVFNSCLENCVCTNNQCGAPTIYYNDPRCGECDNDNDCNKLDKDYCDRDVHKHDEGRCVNYNCIAETTVIEDCSILNGVIGNCGISKWSCSEEINEVNCVITSISPQDSLCRDYCSGDIRKEGYCDPITYLCNYIEEDCNKYDNAYCSDTFLTTEDYTCENADCVLGTLTKKDCDNGRYCDGQETCLNAQCVDGTLVDCSDNNLDPITTCYNIPDNIDYTWDYFAGFISECDEINDRCTTGSISLTHICDKVKCNAECSIVDDCPEKCTSSHKLYTVVECNDCKCDYSSYRCVVGKCSAECDEDTDCSCKQDYCDRTTLVDYPDHGICGTSGAKGCLCQVSESVEGECKPTLIPRSPQCGECENDDDCNRLDRDYCDGNLVKHDEGRCVDYNCIAETNIVGDCDDLDRSYCDGTLIQNEDYKCVNAECVVDLIVTDCDNSLYCDGQETCSNAECVDGSPIDCSRYDLDPIEKCSHIPDDNYFTFDYFAGFISECDEENDRCTKGSVELTHTCNSDRCNAPCEEDSDCELNEICDLSTCRCKCVPKEEVCDGMDNDCDGCIDEHLTRDCGIGDCIGTQDCTNGIWSICSSYQYDCGVCCICDEDGAELYDETQDNDCCPTICPDSGCGLDDCDPFEFALFPETTPNECFDLKECTKNECEAECYDEDLFTDDISFRASGGILDHIGGDMDFDYTSKIDFSGWLRKVFFDSYSDGVASLEVITTTEDGKRVVLNIRADTYDSTIGCDEIYTISKGRGTYWKTGIGIETIDCGLEYWIDRLNEKINIIGNCDGITFRIDDIGNLVFV